MIELENVTKEYPMGETVYHALRGVDLEISEREFLAISGPSGSGKSTLLHVIGALHRPTGGRALFEGKDLGSLSRDELAQLRNTRIGFIFQQFYLLPRATAQRNVELPMVYAGVRPPERRARAAACLDRVGLSEFAHHLPTQLSGGQAQRVALARALVNSPALLLGDEPTGNLDSQTTKEILQLFVSLHEEGRTVVLVTHEREIAEQVKREVVLRDGRIEEDTRATH
ncbi:MAG: ABC transporter ATP-binding protein [Candidatus Bipolaricaulota bacterium]|nr:ABC transporter ATP-binding protein [Candidatus Bipolaricaulota bacterium]